MRPRCAWVMVAAVLHGCDVQPAETPTIEEHYASEIESERAELIGESRQRLAEIDEDIVELEQLLAQEEPNPDEDRLGEWRRELYDLKEERRALLAEVKRAERASPEEWEAMRGPLAKGIDGLEAGADELIDKIRVLFDDD